MHPVRFSSDIHEVRLWLLSPSGYVVSRFPSPISAGPLLKACDWAVRLFPENIYFMELEFYVILYNYLEKFKEKSHIK